jgi:hypothetical protein
MAGQNQDRNIGIRQMGGLAVGGMLVGAGIYNKMFIEPQVHFGNRPVEITRSDLDTLAKSDNNLNKAGFRAKFIKLINQGNKQTTIGMNDILSVSNSVIFVRQKMNDNTKQFQKEFDQILVSHEAVFDTVTHKKIPLIIKFSTKTDLAEGGVKGDKIYVMNINVNDCIKDGKIDKTQIKSIILEQINEFNQKKETFYVAQEDKKVYDRISNGISPAINKIIKESSQKKLQASDILEISKSINGKLRNNSYSKHQYNIEENTLKNMVKEFNDILSKTQSGITFELSNSKTCGNLIMKHNNVSYLIFDTKLGNEDNINTSEGDTKVSLVQISVGEFKSNTNTITNKPEIQYTSHKPTTNQTKPSTTTVSVTGGSINVTRPTTAQPVESKAAPKTSVEKNITNVKTGQSNFAEFVRQNPGYDTNRAFMTSPYMELIVEGSNYIYDIAPIQLGAVAEGHLRGKNNKGQVMGDSLLTAHIDPGDGEVNTGHASNAFRGKKEYQDLFEKYLKVLIPNKDINIEAAKRKDPTALMNLYRNGITTDQKRPTWLHFVSEFERNNLFNEYMKSIEITENIGLKLGDIKYFQNNEIQKIFVRTFINDTVNQNGIKGATKFIIILNKTKHLYFKENNGDILNWLTRAKLMYYSTDESPAAPRNLAEAESVATSNVRSASGLKGPIYGYAMVLENGKIVSKSGVEISEINTKSADYGTRQKDHVRIVKADIYRRYDVLHKAFFGNNSVFDTIAKTNYKFNRE